MTDAEPTPNPPVPSPQVFARPAPPPAQVTSAGASDGVGRSTSGTGEATANAVDARFAPTGDVRVDQVIAHLPHPEEHPKTGGTLPDPALLDAHIADITSVHRQLQQRLSDLSG